MDSALVKNEIQKLVFSQMRHSLH